MTVAAKVTPIRTHIARSSGHLRGRPPANLTPRQLILREFIAASLEGGYGARDAFDRAISCVEWLRLNVRDAHLSAQGREDIRYFCRHALKCAGGDSGTTLASRAIQAAKLLHAEIEANRYRRGKSAVRRRDEGDPLAAEDDQLISEEESR